MRGVNDHVAANLRFICERSDASLLVTCDLVSRIYFLWEFTESTAGGLLLCFINLSEIIIFSFGLLI